MFDNQTKEVINKSNQVERNEIDNNQDVQGVGKIEKQIEGTDEVNVCANVQKTECNKGVFNMNGIVLVNKPAGISSNGAVNVVKRALGAKKCGHLGTLDLEGEGLLPVTINAGTKLFDYFLTKDKTYEAVFEFGRETDTLDLSGKVTKVAECHLSRSDVEEACKQMIGKYAQMPPQYSAKKVNGKVAYKEARKGEVIELKPKEVEIFSFKVLKQLEENIFRFEISCSSGTYIRSLCRDVAEKMSTYGIMHCILRTRCGGFYLKDAYTLEQIKNGDYKIISCDSVFDCPSLRLNKEEAGRLLNGQIIKVENERLGKIYRSQNLKKQNYKVYQDNLFLGVGVVENEKLKLLLRLI